MRKVLVLVAALAALLCSCCDAVGTLEAPHRTRNLQADTTADVQKKMNDIVSVAPPAELQNGIDDIDPKGGKCVDFVTASSCKDVTPGEGKLADCIKDLIAAADAADNTLDVESVPDECQAEVYNFNIVRGKNINANLPLAKACKADAERLCKNFKPTDKTLFKEGSIISCLREARKNSPDELKGDCQKELFQLQVAIAIDYRADAGLYEICKDDAGRLCGDVKEGGGRVQACLRDNRAQVNWTCAEAMFQLEWEQDEDLRLSVRLFRSCLADKNKFCAEIPPGMAAARDCLVEARNDPGFSDACRGELESMLERRVRDFRIDTRLTKACGRDMHALCGEDGLGGEVLELNKCLQDFVDDIEDPECKSMVRSYQQLAAEDIRFDVPLAEACAADRQKVCGTIPPGSARVIRCLQTNREKLSPECQTQLFDDEVQFSENIDFQFPMKKACVKEINRFCKDVPHGNARVIRCLQENKQQSDFGKECKKEVVMFEQKASQDYRLNSRLRSACSEDIPKLCKDVSCAANQDKVSSHKVCGGTVLRCLTQKMDFINSTACKKEVLYFEKMEVTNYNNDVILAAACRTDVDKLCKEVQPGEGRIHQCLRANRQKLSAACKREELILEEQEAEHIELRPGLLQACSSERKLFCKEVAPGGARVFRCLAEKLADPDFGATCRNEIIRKLQRRQANWKLDPPLRRACRADVADMCKEEDGRDSEKGDVYQCLLMHNEDLDPGCKKELGRAVHMAFFIWTPGAVLTHPCDADVVEVCLKQRPNMDRIPGAVGACLADALERIQAAESTSRKVVKEVRGGPQGPPVLSDACRVLADVAEPPNMQRAFETTLSAALLESHLSQLESKTGMSLLERDRSGHAQGVTLTGWVAVLGMAALVLLMIAGAMAGWKHYHGMSDANTVVLKARPQYKRVATNGD